MPESTEIPEAHINTKGNGNDIKGDPGKFMANLLNERKKEEVCVHVSLCVEFNTAFNNFSVISL